MITEADFASPKQEFELAQAIHEKVGASPNAVDAYHPGWTKAEFDLATERVIDGTPVNKVVFLSGAKDREPGVIAAATYVATDRQKAFMGTLAGLYRFSTEAPAISEHPSPFGNQRGRLTQAEAMALGFDIETGSPAK